jgi:uncharacterized membrane protein
MDFILWATRSLHLFAVVVWIGGLLYQAVIVFHGRPEGLNDHQVQQLGRFVPFIWMCIWTILVTGIALMLFNPHFRFLHYDNAWSIVLGAKQFVFFAMVFLTVGYSRMLSRFLEERSSGKGHLFGERMVQLARVNVGLAIVALLLASSLE